MLLEDYGLIGDMQSTALVGRNGPLLEPGDADQHLPMATYSTTAGRPPHAANPQLALQIQGGSRTW
jgi:hypothetical protein